MSKIKQEKEKRIRCVSQKLLKRIMGVKRGQAICIFNVFFIVIVHLSFGISSSFLELWDKAEDEYEI